MNRLLPIILSAATLPLTALAAEPPPMPPHAGAAPGFRLQSREQVAMQMVIRKLLLERYDADGDGQLDGDERRRLMEDAHAARKQQALAFIRRFDADADGNLDAKEREAMKQALEARQESKDVADSPPPPPQTGPRGPHKRRHHGPRPPHPNMGKEGRIIAFMVQQLTMDAYDADKNGILDTTESERLREEGAALYEARRAELLTRYDADRNGRLSEAEFRSALPNLHRPRQTKRGEEELQQPPRRPHHGPMSRLLGTHFDVDILRHLAQPETPPAAPCAPSTSSTN